MAVNTSKSHPLHRVHEHHEIAVHLSPRAFRALWFLLVLIRVACIVFLSTTTRLYWFIAHPYMSYYADLLSPSVGHRFKSFGVVFGLVAAAHTLRLLQTIYCSLRLRRFVLDVDRASTRVGVAPTAFVAAEDITLEPEQQQQQHESAGKDKHNIGRQRSGSIRRVSEVLMPPAIQKNARLGWVKLFARRGFFGVESDFFHARFLVREIIEYVSQTVQVYKSSMLIAKPWINNLYVALMVTNCWSTPLLQRAFQHSPAIERLLCLAVDLLLDMGAAMGIPLLIFAPYVRSFDYETYNFELEDLYDDTWFANMVKENQQLVALSVLDFVFKIVPHLSIYSCIASINVLVKQRAPMQSSLRMRILSEKSVKSARSTRSGREERDGVAPTTAWAKRVPSTRDYQPMPLPPPGNKLGRWGMLVSHTGLFLWGLAILVLHLLATRTSQSLHVPACKQPIRPWFATKYACSVMNFNCHRNGSTGVSEDALDFLQEESLVALVISHCPALTIPKSIRRFQNLLGIDIFNSTLVEWSADASITRAHHPSLAYIIFVRVNMTELPPGVLEALPDATADFEIAVSNITSLPSDLHERWHPMALFYVEHTLMREFPSALRELSVDDLSLVGNSIAAIPEFPLHHAPQFVALALSHNPLTSLPASLGDTSDLGFLSIDGTLVAELPPWMESVKKSATTIHAFNTPFCDSKSADERARDFGPSAVLTCSDTNPRSDGKYPLALMASKRPW